MVSYLSHFRGLSGKLLPLSHPIKLIPQSTQQTGTLTAARKGVFVKIRKQFSRFQSIRKTSSSYGLCGFALQHHIDGKTKVPLSLCQSAAFMA